MNIGDECLFAGYTGVPCLILRFIYRIHDQLPFVEIGFALNAVIVLISMFNSNIKEPYQYFLLNSSVFEMMYLTIYYYCHGPVDHAADIGNCLPTRVWSNETDSGLISLYDSNVFIAVVRTVFRQERYSIYFSQFLLTITRCLCIFSIHYRDKLNEVKNVLIIIFGYDVFIRLYEVVFFYVRELYEESGVRLKKFNDTERTLLMIAIIADAIIRVLLIFSSMMMSIAIFVRIVKQMKFQMGNNQKKLLKDSLRISICLIVQSGTYLIYIIISLSENVLIMNFTLTTDVYNLMWALKYAQEPFLHVCILVNAFIALFFIGGYRKFLLSLFMAPVNFVKDVYVKTFGHKTPTVNISARSAISNVKPIDKITSTDSSNHLSWIKKILANSKIIFTKQQISAVILLIFSIALAALILAIGKTNNPTFLTNNNATTTTTTQLPNKVTEVNVTTFFVVGANVTDYDPTTSLQPLSSCSCENGTKHYYPNQSKDLSDWTIQAALHVCNGYNTTSCECEELCICGESPSSANTTCFSLLPNMDAHVKFYPHCDLGGDCHMYTVFDGNSTYNFVNEKGDHPMATGADESFGVDSNFFKAVSVGCHGCEEIRNDKCGC